MQIPDSHKKTWLSSYKILYLIAVGIIIISIILFKQFNITEKIMMENSLSRQESRFLIKTNLILHNGVALCMAALILRDEDAFYDGLEKVTYSAGYLTSMPGEKAKYFSKTVDKIRYLKVKLENTWNLDTKASQQAISILDDELNSIYLSLSKKEADRVHHTAALYAKQAIFFKYLGIFLIFFVSSIIGLTGWAFKMRRKAELSLKKANLNLEETVKKRTAEIQQSKAQYKSLVEDTKAIAWEVDLESLRFTYISPKIYNLTGYPSEMWKNFEFWASIIYPADRDYCVNFCQTETEKGKDHEFEYRINTANGKTIWVKELVSVIKDDEKPIYLRGYLIDITERKQAEQEKIKAQEITANFKKMALVGQIAGKMAHDFNNILGIIMGNTELSLLDCKDTETKKTLKLIFEQTLRGKNLTKNLVAFAKDQEPKQQFFSINEKIGLVQNLLKKDLEGVDAIKEDGLGIPDLLADPGMIEHALVNLLQNSIHATSMVEQPQIIIRTFHKNKDIYIEIEDNGCGIPEEALDRIYEPAFTLKGSSDVTNSYKPGIKGTGYGMANVKKYIEQHKGNILIDSKIGEGTKITISLPVMKKELTEKEIIEIQKDIFYSEKYILLVEDEQAISDVQYKVLTHEPCNHKVDIAATGQMAVDLFNRNKYDFVSLDYVLSGKLNGMDVYKNIRQTNDTIPILFVSGNLDFLESIKELKHKDNYIDHLSKPCQNKDYVTCINDLLGKNTR